MCVCVFVSVFAKMRHSGQFDQLSLIGFAISSSERAPTGSQKHSHVAQLLVLLNQTPSGMVGGQRCP